MAKIFGDSLRRLLLPCFSPAPESPPAPRKRLSTSLRSHNSKIEDSGEIEIVEIASVPTAARASRSMVVGTIFGPRRGGHVWFCVQHDRSSATPTLLLELSIPTLKLVAEMARSGIVRIALECSEGLSCPLRAVPSWTLSINGRRIGSATRRKAGERTRAMLETMRSMTVAAGVIPPGDGEEVMYMRANYEHVVGNSDSEAFHLINPDGCPGQELSFFLLRSR